MAGSVVSPTLVGRKAEAAALRAAYERARSGQAVTALVSGEAGIGKSRLVAAAAKDFPDEPLVLTGGCLELGSLGAPYVPFAAILRQLVRLLGREHVDRFLPLGESAVGAWLPGVDPVAVPQGRTRLLEDMLTLVGAAAAERPVVLVVEDLHWADASSRELFAYLARNLGDSRVLLIGTMRTGELAAGHPNRQLLAELGRRAELVRLRLGALEPRQVGELLAAIDGRPADPARSRAAHRRSGGNPLFVEMLSDAGEGSAEDLRALLLTRVTGLPESAREVLSMLAVAGAEAGDEILPAISDLPEELLHDALAQLVDHDVVVVREGGYTIRHDLIREAVYASLLPGQRRKRHARYARALADRADHGMVLAEQWLAAGEVDSALPAAWRAAAIAGGQFAYDEQLHSLEVVLDLWDEVDDPDRVIGVDHVTVLEHAAAAAFAAGRSSNGVRHSTSALDEMDSDEEPERVARLLGLRGRLRNAIDAGGADDLRRALELVPPGRADRLRGGLSASLAAVSIFAYRHDEARAHALEALRIAGELGDEGVRAWALLVVGRIHDDDAEIEQATRVFDAAREAARKAGDDRAYLTAFQWEAMALGAAGRWRQSVELARIGQQEAERVGLVRSRGSMLAAVRATFLRLLGEWDEVVEVVEDALAENPPPFYAAFLRLSGADVARCRGDFGHFEELLRQVSQYTLHGESSREADPEIAVQQIAHATERGDLEQADRVLGRQLDPMPAHWQCIDGGRLALAGARLQRARRATAPRNQKVAAAVADRLVSLTRVADATGTASAPAAAYRLTFDAETGAGDLASWDRAAAAWRELDNPHELAITLTAGARTAVASNNRPGARRRLREAREIATRLGARPLLAEIDDLARRARLAGEPSAAVPNDFGLTSRELDVLRVLARGRSNQQIADELFITTNTVATHVARILTKLGATTRTEAAAHAHQTGILDN